MHELLVQESYLFCNGTVHLMNELTHSKFVTVIFRVTELL